MAHPPRRPFAVVVRPWWLVAVALLACGDAPSSTAPDVAVRVDRIAIDQNNTPVVVLEEQDGPRWLPIWIGTAEAYSIALEIEQRSSPRPNSHDLTRDLIRGLDGTVERVVVTELRGGTYYAVLAIAQAGRHVEIDARPSDAIAIALRDGAPIFVRETLFEQAGGPEIDESDAPKREI